MATLIRNAGSQAIECDAVEFDNINNRIVDANFDLGTIRTEVLDLHATVTGNTNTKIQDIKKATTFPIKDILEMMIAHEGCKYVRVYNGFNSQGEFVTYMAPLDKDLKTYPESKTSSPCCACRPCLTDRILNP